MRVLLFILAVGIASPASAQLPLAVDRYHGFDEMTAFLRQAATAHPDLATLSSLGRSHQGRDLWLLALTNRKTGAPEEKPALLIDGCLDSSEVVTSEGVLYTIKHLLDGYGRDPRITRILDRRTIYLVPRIMPDQTELYLTTPFNARSLSAAPMDEDGDGRADEDPDDDVNGDGHVVQMRVKDPDGDWTISPRDPRLMVRRRPGDLEGTFYRVLLEGRDDDGDGRYNEDRLGGVDPNRNFPGNWVPVSVQNGAGPYPLYVQEVRALVEFIETHRNIAGYLNHHSSGGVILRPSTTHDDSTIPAADLRLLRTIAARALEETGYWLATSVYDWRWPPGTPDTKPGQTWRRPDGSLANDPRDTAGAGGGFGGFGGDELAGGDPGRATDTAAAHVVPAAEGDDTHAYAAYGGSIEFTYEMLGIVSYASEQWRAAWDHDTDGDGVISDLERLDWNDRRFGGSLFVDWAPFTHPQLGEVEIGGWKKYTTSSPPPGKYLEDESARQFRFNLMMAGMLPEIGVESAVATPLGGGLYRVSARIRNTGVVPTATQAMERVRRASPVTATLAAKGDVEFIGRPATQSLGHLEGAPAGRATAEWIVRVKSGGPLEATVAASAPTAGGTSRAVEVGRP